MSAGHRGIPAGRRERRRGERPWALFAASLSPFALKVASLLDAHGLAYRWVPGEAGFVESLRTRLRVARVHSGAAPLTWPERDPLDEFPLVPYLFGPDGENLYDSSAIGQWLDDNRDGVGSTASVTIPIDDPALELAVRLVDEYADEFGLYMAHHNRWVVAARDNGAGERLAAEFKPLLGPAAAVVRRQFPARQVRRLPYLFSVADPADASFDDLPAALRPPGRDGFPPTHALLDECFARLLAVLEALLDTRPYLFGERFTLADASLYGQLQMNVTDAAAEARMRRRR